VIYRRPSRVAFVSGDIGHTQLHVKALPDGEVHAMAGSAAMIWWYAAEGHCDVPARVAEEMGLDPSSIQDEVADFIDRLVEMALLEPADEAAE